MGRLLAVVAAVGLLALTAPACTPGDGDALTVYSGRSADLISPLLEDFAEQTGIDVDFRDDTSTNLALLIDQEGDRSPADVFLSQSPGAVAFLDQRGRLQALPDDLLAQVDESDHAADGAWVGLSGRVRTLVYNTEQVDAADLPASVLDLTDARYAGMLGIAPGNASFQDFVTAMRLELGEDVAAEWLAGIAANDPEQYADNNAILDAVNRGEVAMGLVNHYYWFRSEEEDPSQPSELHFFAPGDLGSLLLVSAASILDTAGDVDDARRLVEFLLSEEAQRYFAEETDEYPLAAGVAPPSQLPPLDSIASLRIDLQELGDLARTTELLEQAGLTG